MLGFFITNNVLFSFFHLILFIFNWFSGYCEFKYMKADKKVGDMEIKLFAFAPTSLQTKNMYHSNVNFNTGQTFCT